MSNSLVFMLGIRRADEEGIGVLIFLRNLCEVLCSEKAFN